MLRVLICFVYLCASVALAAEEPIGVVAQVKSGDVPNSDATALFLSELSKFAEFAVIERYNVGLLLAESRLSQAGFSGTAGWKSLSGLLGAKLLLEVVLEKDVAQLKITSLATSEVLQEHNLQIEALPLIINLAARKSAEAVRSSGYLNSSPALRGPGAVTRTMAIRWDSANTSPMENAKLHALLATYLRQQGFVIVERQSASFVVGEHGLLSGAFLKDEGAAGNFLTARYLLDLRNEPDDSLAVELLDTISGGRLMQTSIAASSTEAPEKITKEVLNAVRVNRPAHDGGAAEPANFEAQGILSHAVMLFHSGSYLQAFSSFLQANSASGPGPARALSWACECLRRSGFLEAADELQICPNFPDAAKKSWRNGVVFTGVLRDQGVSEHEERLANLMLSSALIAQSSFPVTFSEDLQRLRSEFDYLVGIKNVGAGKHTLPDYANAVTVTGRLSREKDSLALTLLQDLSYQGKIQLSGDPALWQSDILKHVDKFESLVKDRQEPLSYRSSESVKSLELKVHYEYFLAVSVRNTPALLELLLLNPSRLSLIPLIKVNNFGPPSQRLFQDALYRWALAKLPPDAPTRPWLQLFLAEDGDRKTLQQIADTHADEMPGAVAEWMLFADGGSKRAGESIAKKLSNNKLRDRESWDAVIQGMLDGLSKTPVPPIQVRQLPSAPWQEARFIPVFGKVTDYDDESSKNGVAESNSIKCMTLQTKHLREKPLEAYGCLSRAKRGPTTSKNAELLFGVALILLERREKTLAGDAFQTIIDARDENGEIADPEVHANSLYRMALLLSSEHNSVEAFDLAKQAYGMSDSKSFHLLTWDRRWDGTRRLDSVVLEFMNKLRADVSRTEVLQ